MRETADEEVRTVEVRVPVIRLPKLPTGEAIILPERQRIADLCEYLANHLYEHRADLSPTQFRHFLDEYARYHLLAQAGIDEYPIVIAEQ